jgi:hypothetical protein
MQLPSACVTITSPAVAETASSPIPTTWRRPLAAGRKFVGIDGAEARFVVTSYRLMT